MKLNEITLHVQSCREILYNKSPEHQQPQYYAVLSLLPSEQHSKHSYGCMGPTAATLSETTCREDRLLRLCLGEPAAAVLHSPEPVSEVKTESVLMRAGLPRQAKSKVSNPRSM